MRTERNKETISYHLKAIGKISKNNIKKWFNGGADALQRLIDKLAEANRKRKIKKYKNYIKKVGG